MIRDNNIALMRVVEECFNHSTIILQGVFGTVALTQVEARIAGIKGEIRTINEAVEAANKGEAPQE